MIPLKFLTKFSDIPVKLYNIKCVHCGKMFQAKNSHASICSPECTIARRKEAAKELNKKRAWYTAKCVVCGKVFSNKEPKKGIPRRRTCRAACQQKLAMGVGKEDPLIIIKI